MIKVGDVLILDSGFMKDNPDYKSPGRTMQKEKYEVIEVYKHHVLVKDSNGFKRSVPNGELIRAGYMQQSLRLETLKRERG